jgi:hypothetical protein
MSDRSERKEQLQTHIRAMVEVFFTPPTTGSEYHVIKNKLAEYYSLCQAEADEKWYQQQQEQRVALGIITKEDSDAASN